MTAPSRSRSSSASRGLGPTDTGSLFDLSGHGGSRRKKIALVVALDLILVGAGLAMIWSYLSSRSDAADKSGLASASSTSTPSTSPTPIDSNASKDQPTAANVVDQRSSTSKTSSNGSNKGKTTKAGNGPGSAGNGASTGSGSSSTTTGGGAGSGSGSSSTTTGGNTGSGSGSGSSAGSGSGSSGSGSGSSDPGAGSGSSDPGSGSGSSGSGSGDPGAGSGSGDPGAGSGSNPVETEEEEVARFASRIDGVVSRNQGALARCYAQAAKSHSPEDPLKGRVEVRFRVMPDESVARVKAQSNTTGSTVLASCLVSHVRTWRFPGGPSNPLDFVWPFSFRPKN